MAQGLKLIMAMSADGFLCRGSDDDMRWTGLTDKRLFHALTMTGGAMGAGRKTCALLPPLPGRTLVCLSNGPADYAYFPTRGYSSREKAVMQVPQMSLGMFAHRYPGAWLLGGPTVASEALDTQLVDEVHLCQSPAFIGGVGSSSPPLVPASVLIDRMGYLRGLGCTRLADVEIYHWRKQQ